MFDCFTRQEVKTAGGAMNVVVGGAGPALLLLHGYPQTHVMWHRLADRLAERFTVVAADLRGYGDSARPASDPEHLAYSKRAMAQDQVETMAALGFDSFLVAGHDRGARVGHRLALDHPRRVRKLAVLDIVPTREMFAHLTQPLATGYYHWFFLIQGGGLPERLIGADPELFLRSRFTNVSIAPEAFAEYLRCFKEPATIHSTCEDYRAAATIDLVHDQADLASRITCPLLVLWGARGRIAPCFDVLQVWRGRATDVRGRALPCGHFLPEEAPDETLEELLAFFGQGEPQDR